MCLFCRSQISVLQFLVVLRGEADLLFQEVIDGPVVRFNGAEGLFDPVPADTAEERQVVREGPAPGEAQNAVIAALDLVCRIVVRQHVVLDDRLAVHAEDGQERDGSVAGPVLSADTMPEDCASICVQQFFEKALEHGDALLTGVHDPVPGFEVCADQVAAPVQSRQFHDEVLSELQPFHRSEDVLRGRKRITAVLDAGHLRVLAVRTDITVRAEVDVLHQPVLFDELLSVVGCHVGELSGPDQLPELHGPAVFGLVPDELPRVLDPGEPDAVHVIGKRLFPRA